MEASFTAILLEVVEMTLEVRRIYNAKQPLLEQYYGEDGNPVCIAGGYAGIEQEFDEDGRLVLRRYVDGQRQRTERTDGVSEMRVLKGEKSYNAVFLSLDGSEMAPEGMNLVCDVNAGPDGFTEWFFPAYNSEKSNFTIGFANLSEKKEGDTFTCQIEVEFSGVSGTPGQAFRFRTQGAVDGVWDIGNIWDSGLISLEEPPEDGIYTFTCTKKINKKMAQASTFSLGFRCDYWGSGAFRVRNVKIEKGGEPSPWTPGF